MVCITAEMVCRCGREHDFRMVLVSIGRLAVLGRQEAGSAGFALLPVAFAATPPGPVLRHCYCDLPDSFARTRFCRVAFQFAGDCIARVRDCIIAGACVGCLYS